MGKVCNSFMQVNLKDDRLIKSKIYCCSPCSKRILKVRNNRKQIFQPQILQKNERTNLLFYPGIPYRIEKQIRSFVFLQKFLHDNFVSRSTDLQNNVFSQKVRTILETKYHCGLESLCRRKKGFMLTVIFPDEDVLYMSTPPNLGSDLSKKSAFFQLFRPKVQFNLAEILNSWSDLRIQRCIKIS